MAAHSFRDIFNERNTHMLTEWQSFQSHQSDPERTLNFYNQKDRVHLHYGKQGLLTEKILLRIEQSGLDRVKQALRQKNLDKREPYEFYTSLDLHTIPDTRQPSPGIDILPIRYHSGRVTTADEIIPETGYPLHPLLQTLINSKYPQYMNITLKYCRPLGTTDATFNDFNKQQTLTQPFSDEDQPLILTLVKHHMDPTPYQPIHYIDTFYAGMPLNTGTGYHNKHSFKTRAHAKFSHPQEFTTRPTSKGYYINATFETNRTLIHRIKYTGIPIPILLLLKYTKL